MGKAFHGKGRFGKWKGVYVAMVAVLLALGAVGVAMTSRTLFHSQPEESSLPSDEPVEQVVTGQPDDRTTTTTTSAVSTTAQPTTATEEAPDLYILPLSNTVQKAFSVDAPLYSVTMGDWRIHGGVDFAGTDGQDVKALANGTVLEVEETPLWGWVVTIDHGVEVHSRYCGVTPVVSKGEEVEVGEVIGRLSEIPCESLQSPHLHLEMTIDGQPVDPVTALAKEVRYADSLTAGETTTTD